MIQLDKKRLIRIVMLMGLMFASTQSVNAVELTQENITSSVTESNQEDTESSITENVDEKEVNDLDLGEFQTTMTIGETQLLTVTILPLGIEAEVFYSSLDSNIATVNGMGRITAVTEGTTTIQVQCQEVKKDIIIMIEKKQEEIEDIMVTDIDLGNYETEVEVDGTVSLQATVIPSNATDTQITYHSSNPSVATVTSKGEIKGLKIGSSTITVRAGEITKTITIKVKKSGKLIKLNAIYVVLKVGNSFQLEASVEPQEANQEVEYKVLDSKVLTVSPNGNITAKSIGSTSVIVSNDEVTNSVTVIVNETGENKKEDLQEVEEVSKEYTNEEARLLEKIRNEQNIIVDGGEWEKLTSPILQALHKEENTILIEHDTYSVFLQGKDIVNYDNELDTHIVFEDNGRYVEIIVNEGEPLPGQIEIRNELFQEYDYLYLYNEAKGIYEKLEFMKEETIILDMAGRYALSNEKPDGFQFHAWYFAVAGGILIVLISAYIYVKKKHWLW